MHLRFPLRPILMVGDIHGEWGHLNNIIKTLDPTIIVASGDFGYWPSKHSLKLKDRCIKNRFTRIYFCDGNHEDHWKLKELHDKEKKDVVEVYDRVYHVKRGTVLNLAGIDIMFMGGAESRDKEHRTNGYDLFTQEEILSYGEFMNIDFSKKFDVVVSHTCPEEVLGEYVLSKIYEKTYSFDIQKMKALNEPMMDFFYNMSVVRDYDPTRKALDHLIQYHPKHWFFGHWHTRAEFVHKGINFTGLELTTNKSVKDSLMWIIRDYHNNDIIKTEVTKMVPYEYPK